MLEFNYLEIPKHSLTSDFVFLPSIIIPLEPALPIQVYTLFKDYHKQQLPYITYPGIFKKILSLLLLKIFCMLFISLIAFSQDTNDSHYLL